MMNIGDPNWNGKLYDNLNGKPAKLDIFEPGNSGRGYYQDSNKAWWIITGEFSGAAAAAPDQWRVALLLNMRNGNVPIYIASDGKPIAPGWSSGTSSSPQAALDHIDAFAIRNRVAPSRFPWWIVVIGVVLYKRRRR